MWAPNIVLTIVGVMGLIRVSRESGSTRGGDFQEVLDAFRHSGAGLRQPLGRGEGSRMKAMSTLDRYVLGSWVRIFVLTALGFPDRLDPDQPDRHAQPAARPRAHDEGDRLELRVLDPGEHVPGDAGGRPLRHRLHRRRDGPLLRAHGGQGGRTELPPAHAARVRRGAGRVGLAFVVGELAPGRHRQAARAAEGQGRPPDPRALQLRLPRRRRLGLHHPFARRGQPAAQAAHVRAPGHRGRLPRPRHHRRQRELGRRSRAGGGCATAPAG